MNIFKILPAAWQFLNFLLSYWIFLFSCVWVFRLHVFLGNPIVWYPGNSERGIESHRTGATEVSHCMGAGNWPWLFWKSVVFLEPLCLYSETRSHVSQANLELTVLLRTTLDFRSLLHYPLSAWLMVAYHCIWFIWCVVQTQRLGKHSTNWAISSHPVF